MTSRFPWSGILALFLALAPLGAHAEFTDPDFLPATSCDSPIDLRLPGEAMHGLTQTTQGYGDTNLCGFFTFSNYLDSYRISRNGEDGDKITRSSPIAIGVENAIRRNIPFWVPIQNSTDPLAMRFGRWGSTFCALAAGVREIGYCVDGGLPTRTTDETAKFADLTTFFYGKLLQIAETPAFLRKGAIDKRIGDLYAKYVAWATERKAVLLDQTSIRGLIEKNPTKPYETVRTIFLANCSDAAKRRMDLKYSACKSELFIGLDALGIPTEDRDPLRTDRAARKVAELLSRPHAMPVPFAYCSAVLTDGKAYRGKSPLDPNCGIHWSLVAGRKRIGNDCYLLVHNSWEPGFEYAKDWVVDQGDIWVREQELTRAMLLTQWLED